MRSIFSFMAVVACMTGSGFCDEQQPTSARSPSPSSGPLSPDKKWEYIGGDTPELVKAGTSETVLGFSGQCDIGCANTSVSWAPDSKRFAFTRGDGKERLTAVYQLQENKWAQVKAFGEDDQIANQAYDIVKAQADRKGLPGKTFLHQQWWRVEANGWIDRNTLVIHTSLAMRVHRNDGEDIGLGYGSEQLVTLKFDDAGNWKIVKSHKMTGKAAESPSLSTPLADGILYKSPNDSYRIKATADGTALWIVPANDSSRRKPLLGADPDNRSPEEFSGSPDDIWLLDNRQHELYRNSGEFVFSAFTRKRWFAKKATDYASKEFHWHIAGDSAGWSSDSARMLIHFESNLHHRFAYFNTRTKGFEQTPYLKMVNTKLNTEKPYEAFPNVQFAGGRVAEYMVFAEPIDPPPSEAILRPHLAALNQEMNALREKELATAGTREKSDIVEFRRSYQQEWNETRDEAVQLYLPFAPKEELESRKLQFLCDLTQKEVNGLKEQ